MQPLAGPLAALIVASLFYGYRTFVETQRERTRRLRERVAYMLWVAANGARE